MSSGEDLLLHWEDLEVGEVRTFGTVSPSREDILNFAQQFDPQPFHLDDEAAKTSVFGGLCASGWHTCALAMRLMATQFLNRTASLGSPGVENLKWLKPVYPGDVLSLRQTVVDKRASSKRPELGLVRTLWEMFNQHDEQVLHMEGWAMFRRRQPLV